MGTEASLLVSPVGIEPTTNWLKASCSTTELRARTSSALHETACADRAFYRPKIPDDKRQCGAALGGTLVICSSYVPDAKPRTITNTWCALAGTVSAHCSFGPSTKGRQSYECTAGGEPNRT